jgi:uncharacterized membrane protein YhaH (DUF805 family)
MEWYLLALKRYAEFTGRSRRKEYWMYTLYNIVIYTVLYLAGFITLMRSSIYMVFFGMAFIYALAVLVPSLAVAVRRLHDTDKSGWFIFISLVPIVGGIILLVLLCLDSTPGDNRFGPNPKAVAAQIQATLIG